MEQSRPGLGPLRPSLADLRTGAESAGEAGAGGQSAPAQPRHVQVPGHLHRGHPQRALQPPEEARVRQVSAGGQHVLPWPTQKIIVINLNFIFGTLKCNAVYSNKLNLIIFLLIQVFCNFDKLVKHVITDFQVVVVIEI